MNSTSIQYCSDAVKWPTDHGSTHIKWNVHLFWYSLKGGMLWQTRIQDHISQTFQTRPHATDWTLVSSTPCNTQASTVITFKKSKMCSLQSLWDSSRWHTIRHCVVKIKQNSHATVVRPLMPDYNTVRRLQSHKGFKRTSRVTDNLWGSQAIYPCSIQLTCGGNIVKGVHDKKPISLTPWLALKTFWATNRETVKKQ